MSGEPVAFALAAPLTAETVVSYPDGATTSTGIVTHVVPLAGGESGVVLDRTAFHPVDTAWPDQPSDVGVMRFGGETAEVVRAVMGAAPVDEAEAEAEGEGGGGAEGVAEGARLFIGDDVPVRTGAEGWTFCVVHVIVGPAPTVGDAVEVEADPSLRRGLSAGHTACHLAALALDAAFAHAWSKPVSEDPLGSPAFDALAIQSSRIEPFGSVDVYRVGKSLRRKGFSVDALEDLAGVEGRANARLAGWVAAGGAVRIDRDGDGISERRRWVCELPEGRAEIPCGGTHVADVGEFAKIEVAIERVDVTGGVELTMRTAAQLA